MAKEHHAKLGGDHHQRGPGCNQRHHPRNPQLLLALVRVLTVDQHGGNRVQRTHRNGQGNGPQVVRGGVAHDVPDRRGHHQDGKAQVHNYINAAIDPVARLWPWTCSWHGWFPFPVFGGRRSFHARSRRCHWSLHLLADTGGGKAEGGRGARPMWLGAVRGSMELYPMLTTRRPP